MDHILTFKFDAGRKSYRRDLIVPAPRGSSLSSLVRQARVELPSGAHSLRPFLTVEHAEAVEGPASRRRRSELR